MIVVTGGKGFIGSNLINELKKTNSNVINLDTIDNTLPKISNWLIANRDKIECIFHLGAITDTTETNENVFNVFNLNFSIFIWELCCIMKIPLIYVSSAATYGDGSEGFDDTKSIENLKPLNLYGWSKHNFDKFVLSSTTKPPFWVGLKFFNVYGYGESHKGNMASMVYHAYNQIIKTGKIKLFKSHNSSYMDGEQLRDFVYIDDVVDVCIDFMIKKPESGIYNVGTGEARTFNDLAKAVFNSLGIEEKITYIDTPINIRDNYQYFTEAKIDKLKSVDCHANFDSLEQGVKKYINKLKNENR